MKKFIYEFRLAKEYGGQLFFCWETKNWFHVHTDILITFCSQCELIKTFPL